MENSQILVVIDIYKVALAQKMQHAINYHVHTLNEVQAIRTFAEDMKDF